MLVALVTVSIVISSPAKIKNEKRSLILLGLRVSIGKINFCSKLLLPVLFCCRKGGRSPYVV